jgi:hypothetical protein
MFTFPVDTRRLASGEVDCEEHQKRIDEEHDTPAFFIQKEQNNANNKVYECD